MTNCNLVPDLNIKLQTSTEQVNTLAELKFIRKQIEMFELENYKLDYRDALAWFWANVEKPAMGDLSPSMKEVGFWQLTEGDSV